jgi:hypothetical protein
VFIAALVFAIQQDSDTNDTAQLAEVSAPIVSEAAPAPEPAAADPVVAEPVVVEPESGSGGVIPDASPAPSNDGVDIDELIEDTFDERIEEVEVADLFAPGLRQACFNTIHGDGESGIWVSGGTYGLDDGFIFIEGPTLNGGLPVEIPVSAGLFNGPLPITQFDDHTLETFDLGANPDGSDAVSVLPTLATGPGNVITVDASEGPNFDTECFDFDPVEPAPDAAPVESETEVAAGTPGDGATTPDQIVQEFMDSFAEQHRSGDSAALIDSLHPSVRIAFGEHVCSDYVINTTGSIAAATVSRADAPQELTLNTPDGPIIFPEAIPFTVEFTLTDGSTVVNDGHLPINGDDTYWLTMCGVDTP